LYTLGRKGKESIQKESDLTSLRFCYDPAKRKYCAVSHLAGLDHQAEMILLQET